MASRTTRYDRGSLRSPKRTPQGRLRVDGVFTRAGIFEYMNADGTMRRELRTPEEVFRADALASLEAVPVVNDHPREGLLGADDSRAQGWTLEGVRREGDLVVGSLLITDPTLIADIESGKTALSVGYEVDMLAESGNHPVYGRYDAIQTNIRGDHVAVVTAGRAGPEARLRMDSVETTNKISTPGHESAIIARKDNVQMTPDEIKAMQEALAAALARAENGEKALAEQSARADRAEGTVATLEADKAKLLAERKDAPDTAGLERQIRALQAQLESANKLRADAENPELLARKVKARVKIEAAAAAVLGERFRSDVSDRELMIMVLDKTQGSVDKDRSDDYIAARFDAAVDGYLAGERALAQLADAKVQAENTRVDAKTARERMIEANRTLSAPVGAR